MRIFSSKWRMWAAGVVILLALFLLRPGASHLKSRIIASISSAVGRNVDIGTVHFRLLPRPGFDLENLVVYDDPAFGAEPMLRASEVTASLRLTSLLRGRLEIARLDLTEPSLNLVHGVNGGWNLEALVERTAHMPLAPTAKAKTEPRPGFPYIQATSARINFKRGPEKKPYALTNADFSLWQDSENTWGVRLKAQPMRTDLNLNDTGVLQINGTWQRAEKIRDTPVEFSVEWSRAQLGQLTKLFTGSDQGWRGGIQLDAMLTGTPANLEVASDASIQDFRRYDITSGEALTLAVHCVARYSSPEHIFHETVCSAPVGSGQITLKGDIRVPGSQNYELMLAAENIPANAGLMLVQRAKKNLPEDLVASGTLRGSLSIEKSAQEASQASQLRLQGKGEVVDFRLSSAENKADLGPLTIPLLVGSGDAGVSAGKVSLRKNVRPASGARLEVGPFPVAMGRSAPTVRGWIDGSGYSASVTGEAEIGKALRVARMVGVPTLQTTAEGTAEVDLQVAGAWTAAFGTTRNGVQSGFMSPQVIGKAKLSNVQVQVRGTAAPLEISAADLQLLPDGVRIEKLKAKVTDMLWTGSLEMPRGCGTPGACEARFALNANQISLSELSHWASPREKARAWYRMLESGPQTTSVLSRVKASGRVTTDRLQMQGLAVTHVSANASLNGGRLKIADISGDFLGGKYKGQWQADFSTQDRNCSGSGTLTRVSLNGLAQTKSEWIEGTGDASYTLKGRCTAEFWNSADGAMQFDVREATLPHISLATGDPLKISRLTGRAQLQSGAFEIKDAQLDSTSGIFQLSGSASLNREVDLKLARSANGSGAGYAITGTVTEPRVVALPGAEQARLKQVSTK